MYEKYQPLMDYLTENTPYRFELKLGWDYKDIINFLKNDSAEIALLGAATYLEAKKEFDVMPILASLDSDRMPTYRSAIVTRKDNNDIISLSDLKGKTFAFASRRSTSGYLVPLYYLMLVYLVTTFFVSYQYFSIICVNKKKVWLYSLVVSLVMAEIAWTINFWPFGYLTSGAVALILYFVLWDIIQKNFLDIIRKKRIIFNLIFFSVLASLVLISSKWIPVI